MAVAFRLAPHLPKLAAGILRDDPAGASQTPDQAYGEALIPLRNTLTAVHVK